jgi:hypothetical protein
LRLFFGSVILQEQVIAHVRKGQRKGFAESVCAASDKSERLGHGWIVNEKNRFKSIAYNLKKRQKKEDKK